jgi:hypothetical protein
MRKIQADLRFSVSSRFAVPRLDSGTSEERQHSRLLGSIRSICAWNCARLFRAAATRIDRRAIQVATDRPSISHFAKARLNRRIYHEDDQLRTNRKKYLAWWGAHSGNTSRTLKLGCRAPSDRSRSSPGARDHDCRQSQMQPIEANAPIRCEPRCT